ncbi:hypothetical protein C8R34_13918 [Nitrosomonas sp. Nm84]|nr:hypothetical protein C8R34_13918 [Nitrosomonas sp. Nm84]
MTAVSNESFKTYTLENVSVRLSSTFYGDKPYSQ